MDKLVLKHLQDIDDSELRDDEQQLGVHREVVSLVEEAETWTLQMMKINVVRLVTSFLDDWKDFRLLWGIWICRKFLRDFFLVYLLHLCIKSENLIG